MKYDTRVDEFYSEDVMIKVIAKTILFHEFLHHANLEMESGGQLHNSSSLFEFDEDGFYNIENDLVYACSIGSYRSWINIALHKDAPKNMSYESAKEIGMRMINNCKEGFLTQ